jgi:antirestriction protein ArdC
MTRAEDPRTPTRNQELDWQRLIDVALDTPGSVGHVYNRFYEYSFLNQMFLRMQGVAEPVATYKRWQSLGRQVLRGSKASAIVRPIVIKRTTENNDDGTDRTLRFKVVNCLFTASQTDGEPLPDVEVASWDLTTALDNLDVVRRPYELIDGNTQGYSWGRNYAINPVAADPTRTTFHELGHIVLGHTTPQPATDLAAVHRGEREFQAEAAAYLALNELNELTPEGASHSRGYIQHWMTTERPSDRAIRQVFAATDTILKAGRLATPEIRGSPDV